MTFQKQNKIAVKKKIKIVKFSYDREINSEIFVNVYTLSNQQFFSFTPYQISFICHSLHEAFFVPSLETVDECGSKILQRAIQICYANSVNCLIKQESSRINNKLITSRLLSSR